MKRRRKRGGRDKDRVREKVRKRETAQATDRDRGVDDVGKREKARKGARKRVRDVPSPGQGGREDGT